MNRYSLALFLSFFPPLTRAQESKIEDVRERLTVIENTLSKHARDPVGIVERPFDSWTKIPGFTELTFEINNHWAEHVANITEAAPTQNAQAIYFKAAQSLRKSDYQKLILASADEAALGNISITQFKWIISPYEKHLRNMWNEDPPSEELKLVASRVREVVGTETNMGKLMTRIISGDMAATLRNYHPDADPLLKTTSTQTPQSINTESNLTPALTPVNPAPAPAGPLPVKSFNAIWWIAGLTILAVGVVFVACKKKPRA